MSKKEDSINEQAGDQINQESGPSNEDRRTAIKKIAVGVGALAGISVLPENYVKPIVGQFVLPAHAQTSEEPDVPTLTIDNNTRSSIRVYLFT